MCEIQRNGMLPTTRWLDCYVARIGADITYKLFFLGVPKKESVIWT